MSHPDLTSWTVADYERAAEEYLQALPLEHFMEATRHSFQRKVTVQSLDLVHLQLPEVQTFSELLVQYPLNGHLGQVVPDNMIVLSEEEIQHTGSYNLPFEPARPFWVLEYVSASTRRKDYHDNFLKYERELKVPYYLLYDPETKDLRLYHHNGAAYEPVSSNAEGRLPVPELELEVGLLGDWTRFWFRGQLLPLSAELQQKLDEMEKQLQEAELRAEQAEERAEQAEQRAEQEKQRAEEERRRTEQEKRRTEEQRQRAEQEKQRAEDERQRAEQEKRRAEDERQRADEERKRAEAERQGRTVLEAELERARALLRQLQGGTADDGGS